MIQMVDNASHELNSLTEDQIQNFPPTQLKRLLAKVRKETLEYTLQYGAHDNHSSHTSYAS